MKWALALLLLCSCVRRMESTSSDDIKTTTTQEERLRVVRDIPPRKEKATKVTDYFLPDGGLRKRVTEGSESETGAGQEISTAQGSAKIETEEEKAARIVKASKPAMSCVGIGYLVVAVLVAVVIGFVLRVLKKVPL
jgi:hypothetical protein